MDTSQNEDTQTILCNPQLRLVGTVDEAMYAEFRNQLAAAPGEGAEEDVPGDVVLDDVPPDAG